MRYLVLATDYDGTLASDGRVSNATIAAMERLRESGRKIILVTGRTIEDLIQIFPRMDLFDRVVGENGAVIYRPTKRTAVTLAERPPETFIAALRARGVSPIGIGHVILDTSATEREKVLETVHEQGLELQLIFNKTSLTILPTGINKAVGLMAALDEMNFSLDNTVAVGDAENDLSMLQAAGCAVAVEGALETVKAVADIVTFGDAGSGVQELIGQLIYDDLASATGQQTTLEG